MRVLFSKFVTIHAMSSKQSCSSGSRKTAMVTFVNRSARVLARRNSFKVFRINAASHTAEVVNFQAFWNGTLKKLVSNAVRRTKRFGLILVSTHSGVSTAVYVKHPNPASRLGDYLNRAKQALADCKVLVRVDSGRHASILPQLRNYAEVLY